MTAFFSNTTLPRLIATFDFQHSKDVVVKVRVVSNTGAVNYHDKGTNEVAVAMSFHNLYVCQPITVVMMNDLQRSIPQKLIARVIMPLLRQQFIQSPI